MSYSYKINKRDRKLLKMVGLMAAGTHTTEDFAEHNKIKNKIRSGKLPRMHFLRNGEGKVVYPLKLVSTYLVLTRK